MLILPTMFDDQMDSINRLRQSLKRHKWVLLQGETGSGKSHMASYMISSSLSKGLKSVFIVPRRDLLGQMSETFKEFSIPHSFIAAGKFFNPFSNVHIATVGTLVNRLEKISPNVAYLDECHWGAGQLNKIIAYLKSKGVWGIGLSASPEKPDGRGLDEYYDDMVVGPSIRELIDLKRLSDYRLFAPSRPDLSGIKIVAGDYAKGQISEFMEQDRVLIGDAVHHYKTHAMGKLNLTFCTSIKHSQMTAEAFRNAGVPTMHMDGETPDTERRRIARSWATGELLNVCSVDLMCFGYDLASASGIKSAVIESISDLRPTKSRPLQRQKNGRGLRYKQEPAIFLDHSGNTSYHGMPCESVEWSLRGREKNNRDSSEKSVAIRQCPSCFFVHRPTPSCPSCGKIYEIKSREIDQIDGELIELSKDQIKKIERQKQGMARSLDELIAEGYRRGYKPGKCEAWASHVFTSRLANGR